MSGAVPLFPIRLHVLDKDRFTFQELHVCRLNCGACFDHLHFSSALMRHDALCNTQ
jgi:hypothetical protein